MLHANKWNTNNIYLWWSFDISIELLLISTNQWSICVFLMIVCEWESIEWLHCPWPNRDWELWLELKYVNRDEGDDESFSSSKVSNSFFRLFQVVRNYRWPFCLAKLKRIYKPYPHIRLKQYFILCMGKQWIYFWLLWIFEWPLLSTFLLTIYLLSLQLFLSDPNIKSFFVILLASLPDIWLNTFSNVTVNGKYIEVKSM